MKYLVVDDSKMARKMSSKVVNGVISESDEVLTAKNGLEALELYKENSPVLVFMDLTMPIMDGFEAIEKIKEFDSEAKIIVVSADVQKGAMQRAKDNGAMGFINKPIDETKVQAMLEQLGL
jgi:two-component system, chemotaxis family, chemotaxis protein CheY